MLAAEWSGCVAAVLASMVALEECPHKMHVSVYQEILYWSFLFSTWLLSTHNGR